MGLRGLPARRRQRAMVCGTRSCERVGVYPRQESQRGALPACACAGCATGPGRGRNRAGRRLRLCMAGPYVATKYISGFQCGPIYGELAIILEFMYVFGLRNAQTSYETAVATVRLRQRSRRTSLWASLTRCAEHRTPWFR